MWIRTFSRNLAYDESCTLATLARNTTKRILPVDCAADFDRATAPPHLLPHICSPEPPDVLLHSDKTTKPQRCKKERNITDAMSRTGFGGLCSSPTDDCSSVSIRGGSRYVDTACATRSLTSSDESMTKPPLNRFPSDRIPKQIDVSRGMAKAKSYSELKWVDAPLESGISGAHTSGAEMTGESTCLPPPKRPPLPMDASTTALLVVDVQPQYWSDCPAVRKDFPHFPAKLAQTIATCRERGTKLIFVRADYRYSHSPWLAQFARLHEGRSADTMTEVHCDPNDEDFAWEDFATPRGGDIVLPKTSWSSSSNPKLMDWLRGSGIDTVLVCGLITSVCVQHSAFSIFEAGFRTLLVTDACGDRGKARHEAALALYGDYMYELVTADDLVDPELGLVQSGPIWLGLEPKAATGGGGDAATAATSSSSGSTSASTRPSHRGASPVPSLASLREIEGWRRMD